MSTSVQTNGKIPTLIKRKGKIRNLIEFIKTILQLRNPCKTCLVVAACNQHMDCEKYRDHKRSKQYIYDKLTTALAIITVGIGFLGILVIICMSILGFWKFFEIV